MCFVCVFIWISRRNIYRLRYYTTCVWFCLFAVFRFEIDIKHAAILLRVFIKCSA